MEQEKIKKRKIMLIGTGFVGMSFAYTMLNERGIDEMVLVDVNTDKAEGEAMDLNDGLVYANSKMKIKAGSYEEDAADTDVCVLTAGAAQKPGQSRLELVKINANITKGVCESLKANGFHGILFRNCIGYRASASFFESFLRLCGFEYPCLYHG